MKKISHDILITFERFNLILKKYKNLRLQLLTIMFFAIVSYFASWAYFGYQDMLNIGIFYSFMFILLLFNNDKNIHIFCIIFNILGIGLYLFFDNFLDVIGNMIFSVIFIFFHIRLIKGALLRNILKNVYGYPTFNALAVTEKTEKDIGIFNDLMAEIEIAVSNKLLEKEIIIVTRKKIQKAFVILNCFCFAVFVISLFAMNYYRTTQNGIDNTQDFETVIPSQNIYVKGELSEIFKQSAGGEFPAYWIEKDGKFLNVQVPKKLSAEFSVLCDEDTENNVPVKFSGRYIPYSYENPPLAALEKKLERKVQDSEVNKNYILQVLDRDYYAKMYKIFGTIFLIPLLYFVVYYSAVFLYTKFSQ